MPSLKTLLGDELFAQVTEKAGESQLAIVSDGTWFPKEKFDAVNEELKSTKSELKKRDDQLKDLSKSAEDADGMKKRIAELEESNKKAADEAAAALRKQAVDFALKEKLTEAGVRDPRTVQPLLDMERVHVNPDGTVSGLMEQLETLKESSGFLFADAGTGTGDATLVGQRSGDGKSPGGKNPFKPGEGFNLTEQAAIYRADPKKAEALMAEAEASGE